ncbi:MAG: SDR family NAD(P)-dependent oxidoreductase [Planctomycetota bacterium]|nr:SDR family NAD(P)-dependent oxidoreductase [Planctomycetota bacterium]MEE3365736.1 SDR family NAD(P)-dependent oxidoreductase [Planctomycetota bacterium]
MNGTADLSERTAIVTGASNGIGRATAILLAEHGATVLAADFRHLEENTDRFEELGIVDISCDVRQEGELANTINEAVQRTGRLDILVNNAGIGMVKPVEEITEEDWDACMDTNLKGAFFGCRHAVEPMRANGGGAIVNMSSNAGLLPRSHDPVYSISKMALVGLTRSLALCLAPDRIRVNAVCPGPVGDTAMMNADLDSVADPGALTESMIAASPLAAAWDRMIAPEEIAASVLFLVSDQSAMITGTSIGIDGGKSLGVPPATS